MGNVREALFLLASLIAIPEEEERKVFLKVPLVSRKQTYLLFVHVVGCKKTHCCFFSADFHAKAAYTTLFARPGGLVHEKNISCV